MGNCKGPSRQSKRISSFDLVDIFNLALRFREGVAAKHNWNAEIEVERGLVEVSRIQVTIFGHLNRAVELAAIVFIPEVVIVGVNERPSKRKRDCTHGKEEEPCDK